MIHKVLIVDDDEGIRDLLVAFLELGGYEIYCAPSGKVGLRMFYELRPDLVITDAIMPEMDGYQLSQVIRYMCDIPIMMITGVQEPKDKMKLLNPAINDYMTKPIGIDDFLERVAVLLSSNYLHSNDKTAQM